MKNRADKLNKTEIETETRHAPTVFPSDGDDRSDVERTLSDIKQEKLSEKTPLKKKRNPFLVALMVLFFQIGRAHV